MATPTTEIPTETNLIGTLTSNLTATGLILTATFIDKVTGNPRSPQTTTLEYTLDQNNSSAETILADTVTTNANGVTTITIDAAGRNIPKYGTGVGSGTGMSHVIGAAIGCVDIARPINLLAQIVNEKANLSGAAFTGPVTISGSSSYFGLPQLTTTQRDALVSPQNGWKIQNITTGTEQTYEGGVWTDNATGATPNASTTVAGKIQAGTVADQAAHTSVGTTGALLVPQVGNLITTSTGIPDAGKLVVLNGSGQFDSSVVNAIAGSVFTTKGDLLTATASNTPVRLGVGSNNQVLVADSAQTDGIKWGQVPLVAGNFANGTATYPNTNASSSQVVTHNLTVVPTEIEIYATQLYGSGTGMLSLSDGSWNGAGTDHCIYNLLDTQTPSSAQGVDTACVHIATRDNAAGISTQVGTISAVSTTTFTITWVLTNTPLSVNDINMHWKVTG